MTSILFLKEAIYCYILRYNYLRNQKDFINSFLHFLNLDSIFNIFKKKYDLDRFCIFESTDSKKRG